MKTCGKFVLLAIFCGVFLWAAAAMAGEAGTVSCSTPDCGYQENLNIGGRRNAPGVTGYCRSSKKFVRLKLKSHSDVHKTHYCPGTKEPMTRIDSGSKIPEIPCPQCGNLTLTYKLLLKKD